MIDALAVWGEVRVVGRLGGGNRNTVLEIRRGGERMVARRTRRSRPAWTGRPTCWLTWRARACWCRGSSRRSTAGVTSPG